MSTTTYRIVFMALGVALVLVVAFAVLLTPGGDPTPLPGALESVSPADGSIVQRQTSLVINLEPGFDLVLVVDGFTIPPEEINASEPTGRFSWTPGPGATYQEWAPGLHAVKIDWRRPTGFPEPGAYRWSFTIQ